MPEPMVQRVLTADGWIAPPLSPERAADDWAMIRSYAEDAGVDPDGVDRVALTYCYVVETDSRRKAHEHQREAFAEFFSDQRGFDHAERTCLTGSLSDIRRRLRAYEDAGFDQVIVGTPAHTPDDLAEQVDLLAEHVLDAWH